MGHKGLKRAAALLLAGVLAAALPGCTATTVHYSMQMPGPTVPDSGMDTLPPQGDAPAQPTLSPYGSAGLLSFPTVLVSVYLDEKGGAHTWDEARLARSRENLAVAVEWITAQCARYNAQPQIIYDAGQDQALCVRREYDGSFIGGEQGDEGEAFYTAVDALCATLDTAELQQRYGTASVGFLVFLPTDGCAFTMVHYRDDGDNYFYEYSCLYAEDAFSAPGTFDSPAVYAHEILHLYGAPDLYEGSMDQFVTPELIDFVTENWPDAIMVDTYGPDGGLQYGSIGQSICPVTAYRLGLCTNFEGLDRFPALRATTPGMFDYETAPGGAGAVAARPAA